MIVWGSTQPVIPVCARLIYLMGARPESEGDMFPRSEAVPVSGFRVPSFATASDGPGMTGWGYGRGVLLAGGKRPDGASRQSGSSPMADASDPVSVHALMVRSAMRH